MPLTTWTPRDEALSDALDNMDRAMGLDAPFVADVTVEYEGPAITADWIREHEAHGHASFTVADRDDSAMDAEWEGLPSRRFTNGGYAVAAIEGLREADLVVEAEVTTAGTYDYENRDEQRWADLVIEWVRESGREDLPPAEDRPLSARAIALLVEGGKYGRKACPLTIVDGSTGRSRPTREVALHYKVQEARAELRRERAKAVAHSARLHNRLTVLRTRVQHLSERIAKGEKLLATDAMRQAKPVAYRRLLDLQRERSMLVAEGKALRVKLDRAKEAVA